MEEVQSARERLLEERNNPLDEEGENEGQRNTRRSSTEPIRQTGFPIETVMLVVMGVVLIIFFRFRP